MDTVTTLVEAVQTGDHDAFATLVRRFQDMAVGYGYSLLGDQQLAEDVAQEAFLTAYLHLSTLRQPAAFPGWLRRIVDLPNQLDSSSCNNATTVADKSSAAPRS